MGFLRVFLIFIKPKVLEDGIKKAKELGIDLIDEWIEVSDADAFTMVKRINENDGLLVGPSSGAVMSGAVKYFECANEGLGVLIFADDGQKYKSLYSELKLF